MKNRSFIIIILLLAIGVITIFIPKNREYSVYIPDALGTVSEIKIYAKSDSVLPECEDYIRKSDRLFSLTNPESEISRLNKERNISINPETKELLETSLKYTDFSTFNPFCGTLISLWDKAKENGNPPSEEEVKNANSFSYPVSLKITRNHAEFTNPGQSVNLGAIAKGYITDGIINILEENHIESALIYLGGNIYAKGLTPENKKWKIGIANPDNSGEFIGILSATDQAIITSGDYERYFESEGIRYHHILDPETGYPADSGLRSVTIISPNATIGDILSTRCFIAGFEASKEILKDFGAYAIFITTDGKVMYSKELEDVFEKIDNNYAYQAF